MILMLHSPFKESLWLIKKWHELKNYHQNLLSYSIWDRKRRHRNVCRPYFCQVTYHEYCWRYRYTSRWKRTTISFNCILLKLLFITIRMDTWYNLINVHRFRCSENSYDWIHAKAIIIAEIIDTIISSVSKLILPYLISSLWYKFLEYHHERTYLFSFNSLLSTVTNLKSITIELTHCKNIERSSTRRIVIVFPLFSRSYRRPQLYDGHRCLLSRARHRLRHTRFQPELSLILCIGIVRRVHLKQFALFQHRTIRGPVSLTWSSG